MRLKQTVEESWGVWWYAERRKRWEPWISDGTTREDAIAILRMNRELRNGLRFALVRTVHTRQVER